MSLEKIFGYCTRCRKKVLVCCPVLFNNLHMVLSCLTFGLWLPVWLFLSLRSCRCTLCMGRMSRLAIGFSCSGPSLSKPWVDDRFGCGLKRNKKDFNSMLIAKGLVYYAATRSA